MTTDLADSRVALSDPEMEQISELVPVPVSMASVLRLLSLGKRWRAIFPTGRVNAEWMRMKTG